MIKETSWQYGLDDPAFRQLALSAPFGLLLVDSEERVAFANPAACEIVGVSGSVEGCSTCGGFLGCPNSLSAPGCGRTRACIPCPLMGAIRNVLVDRENRGMTGEASFRRQPDGREFWIRFRARRTDLNDKTFAMISFDDITDMKDRENELRLSESIFRAIVTAIPDMIFRFDRSCAFLYCHCTRPQDLLLPSEEFLGRKPAEVLPAGLAQKTEEMILRTFDTRQLQVYDYQIAFGDESRCFEARMTPCGDEEVLCIIRDVTETRRLMEEHIGFERKLNQAQKLEAIGTLASGIAHDINNLLVPIVGSSEILDEELQGNDSLRETNHEILTAALRAKDLVKQILAFGRQVEGEARIVNPSGIVVEAVRLIRSILPSTIRIETSIEEGVRSIFADPTRVNQIVMNLMTNAFHAMEQDGGILTVKVENARIPSGGSPDIEPGDYVRIAISDTGIGIEKDSVDKIFSPFFTTKPADKGTGLGLSVVHGIVRNYHGSIEVFSKPGLGSTFEVLLPGIDTGEEALPESSLEHFRTGGNERILLVDDEPSVADMMGRILGRLGYEVEIVHDPSEALRRFRGKPSKFDIVLTDMTMPGMTGDLLTEEILRIRPGIPVIMCSGVLDNDTVARAKEIGVRGLLAKPIRKKQLADAIQGVIDSAEGTTIVYAS